MCRFCTFLFSLNPQNLCNFCTDCLSLQFFFHQTQKGICIFCKLLFQPVLKWYVQIMHLPLLTRKNCALFNTPPSNSRSFCFPPRQSPRLSHCWCPSSFSRRFRNKARHSWHRIGPTPKHRPNRCRRSPHPSCHRKS